MLRIGFYLVSFFQELCHPPCTAKNVVIGYILFPFTEKNYKLHPKIGKNSFAHDY